MMSPIPDYNKPLPDCEGPKLHPFKDRKAAIKFHRLLSDDENSESGGHAHVFEVSIKSNIYALKVFKFYDASEDEENLLDSERETIPMSRIHAHMDPFYNECRAYGRLMELGLNGKIAVHCYGHLTLLPAMEDDLERKFDVATWDRPDEDFDKPVSERPPLRAIVKELVRNDVPFTANNVKQMLRHLKKLRRLGIYPMDVRARNYRAGLLVDFSAAITLPHYLFETLPRWHVSTLQSDDLLDFDQMIEDAKLGSWVRATPNPEYLNKLRRPPQKPKTFKW